MQQRGPYQKQESGPDDKRSSGNLPSMEIKEKLAAKIAEIAAAEIQRKEERKAARKREEEAQTLKATSSLPVLTAEEEMWLIDDPTYQPKSTIARKREEAIAWLLAHNLVPLPVAPKFPGVVCPKRNKKGEIVLDEEGNPRPLFNGKNPSCLDAEGKPRLINHKQYQTQLPSPETIAKWFAHPDTGVGTLGNDRIKFIDLDRKHFNSQEECDTAAQSRFELLGKSGLLEQTRSGGWRIAIVTPAPSCDITTERNGSHKGELLGVGLFAVLAPTTGYQNFHRSPEIPQVENLEAIDMFPVATTVATTTQTQTSTKASRPEKKRSPRRFQKPDSGLDPYVRFPADCWQFYKDPLVLWLIARHFDPQGRGWAEFTLCAACQLANRKPSTIRLWLTKGKLSGLFRYAVTESIPGVRQARIKIYYASMSKIAGNAGLEKIGAVRLINLESDIKNLRIIATDAIQADLQKASRYAAYREEVAIAKENEREPIKPLKPEEINQPCEKKTPWVLWENSEIIGVPEGFVAYGSSQKTVANRRKLSTRHVRRQLSNLYRLEPSPVKEFRTGCLPVSKKQIHQRLRYSVKPNFLTVVSEAGEDRNKFYVDRFGRVWERKCLITFVERNQLIRLSYRRIIPTPPHTPPEGISDKKYN